MGGGVCTQYFHYDPWDNRSKNTLSEMGTSHPHTEAHRLTSDMTPETTTCELDADGRWIFVFPSA